MALPIHAVTTPGVLAGQSNGQLSATILVWTAGQAGGPEVLLVAPAARAWRAMCAAALTAGHTLKATAAADSYRPYSVQESLFRARYSTTAVANRPTKVWQGRTWWLRAGMATAAVPGTSNHGWGLAVDIGDELDGDAGTEAITTATVNWLSAHAAAYGYSAELQEEPWHWRYWSGDTIPPAVLAYEQGDDVLTDPQNKALAETWAVETALRDGTPSPAAGNSKGGKVWLVEAVKQLQADVAALTAKPAGEVALSPADRAAIVADLLAALKPELRDAVADLGEGGAAQVRAGA